MLNEYGERLDTNGYAPSIIPGHDEYKCFLCGRNGATDKLDRHEIFGGSYRDKSKRLGLWCYLCHRRCHLDGVHSIGKKARQLRRFGQMKAMEIYGWSVEDFRQEFGRNYLEDDDEAD